MNDLRSARSDGESAEVLTVGMVAATRPASIPVLELAGIDYCCGGRTSFESACRAHSVDPAALLEAIARRERTAASIPSGAERTLTQLADHIEATHHAFARECFTRLEVTLPRVVAAHAETHHELLQVEEIVAALRQDMEEHLVREERVVFPWIRRLERASQIHTGPPWSIRRPISCMMHDHDDVATAFRKLHELTAGFSAPATACGMYRSMLATLQDLWRDTREHIHHENNILFPGAVRLERARGESDRGARAESAAS